MRVPLQGSNECMLAVIAGLTDEPIERVRGIAVSRAKSFADDPTIVKWADLWRRSPRIPNHVYWQAVEATLKTLGREDLLPVVARHWGGGPKPAGPVLSCRLRNLPAKGQGAVSFRFRGGGNHICAWEDGMVIDPNHPDKRYTLNEYRHLFRASVKHLSVVNRGEG